MIILMANVMHVKLNHVLDREKIRVDNPVPSEIYLSNFTKIEKKIQINSSK
jgi:hypothetical protein